MGRVPTTAVNTVAGEGYFGNDRADLVAVLPRPLGRALDVGCGAGAVGLQLRDAGASHVTGIELFEDAAAIAERRLDRVVQGPVETSLAELTEPFDTVVCYDVLEHLADPYVVLRELREHAAPGARLHVSVPNARNWRLFRDLFVRGTFGYSDWGHRDHTHLRWFTSRDLAAAVSEAGWHVESVTTPLHHGWRRQVLRLADVVTRDRAREFLVLQWTLLATAP